VEQRIRKLFASFWRICSGITFASNAARKPRGILPPLGTPQRRGTRMRVTIPAQVSFEHLIDTFCRAAPQVDATEYSRFDIDRISRALGNMNAKLTEHENKLNEQNTH
jgi:hypothetical protein